LLKPPAGLGKGEEIISSLNTGSVKISKKFKPSSAQAIDSDSEYKWSDEEVNTQIQSKNKKKKEVVIVKRPVI
jgi:hypothetical protein